MTSLSPPFEVGDRVRRVALDDHYGRWPLGKIVTVTHNLGELSCVETGKTPHTYYALLPAYWELVKEE